MRSLSASVSLIIGVLSLFGATAEATVIWDVSTGTTYAVNDGKFFRVTVDSSKGIAAVRVMEDMGYWIDSQTVKEKNLNPIPKVGLFGLGGNQKEKLQASWNMDIMTYNANKEIINGTHANSHKMEYRDMNLYERQIVNGTLRGYTNLTK